jgi:ATP-dependent Clp protease ATP-binding subunit ClpA
MARAVNIESDKTLPKKRKTRKPMSAEQKKAAGERLAIAREKRLAANPPEYKSIHPDVLARGDEDAWSHINVKKWIKTQKELLSVARHDLRRKVKGAEAQVSSISGYIRNLENYLRSGIYTDLFWGEHGQNRCKTVCLVMAYHPDGTPKRSVGVWYPDIQETWTKEMENER